jgi:hypothetical protein
MQTTPTNRQTGLIIQTDGLTGEVVKQFPLNFQSNGESVRSEIEYCPQINWGKFRHSPLVSTLSKRLGSPPTLRWFVENTSMSLNRSRRDHCYRPRHSGVKPSENSQQREGNSIAKSPGRSIIISVSDGHSFKPHPCPTTSAARRQRPTSPSRLATSDPSGRPASVA